MGNPSRSKPWAVEIRMEDKWHHLNAYVDEDTATSDAGVMKRRAPRAELRIIKKKTYKQSKKQIRGKK